MTDEIGFENIPCSKSCLSCISKIFPIIYFIYDIKLRNVVLSRYKSNVTHKPSKNN